MDKYTIEQIRRYLHSQNSFSEAIHNLSPEAIKAANTDEPLSYKSPSNN